METPEGMRLAQPCQGDANITGRDNVPGAAALTLAPDVHARAALRLLLVDDSVDR